MKKDKLYNIVLVIGISLLALSLVLFVVFQIVQSSSAKSARELVVQIRQLMPATYHGTLDDRVNTMMPSMEVNGTNFCGIIEIPAYNTDLPICDVWSTGSLVSYPCRYTGSIYDRSLIIGGSDQDGQLDFMKEITDGEVLYVTDMTGARFRYTVTSILRTKDVSTSNLTAQDGDLVLFARNTYSLDYTLVICKLG